MNSILTRFIEQFSLPPSYIVKAEKWFVPIAESLIKAHTSAKTPILIGINGCQGSGKSTLSALLTALLTEHYGKSCINISIDDFYYAKKKRLELSESVHPLFKTRGVPGTHNTALLLKIVSELKNLEKKHATVLLPRFDKSKDDLFPSEQWQSINSTVDIIILEGWCVGLQAQTEKELVSPINMLEQEFDSTGEWRTIVNDHLQNSYHQIFKLIDGLIFLKAPTFNAVYKWRCEQEHKLISTLTSSTLDLSQKHDEIMSDKQIERFIQYFERLTKHGLTSLPARSDIVISLNEKRDIENCVIK